MPHYEIGLATRSTTVSPADLEPVVAALNIQAQEHVGPLWDLTARVSLLTDAETIPKGVSPIFIVDQMPGQMHGVHTTDNNLAFAMVLAAHGWQLAASHECIEMLVDPTGEKTQTARKIAINGDALQDADGDFDYIVEACDPVEDEKYAYKIGDVWVSDFYTQQYFDDAKKPGVRYTYRDQLPGPRTVGQNGYLSWRDPATSQLQQLRYFDAFDIVTLDPHALAATDQTMPTLRCHVDRLTETPRVRASRKHRFAAAQQVSAAFTP